MEFFTNFQTLRNKIRKSNMKASKNRNQYPIQEQATLKEIWEYVPCECNNNCTCKKFHCANHWKLKDSLTFSIVLNAFLRMFVDNRLHDRVISWIKGTLPMPDKNYHRARYLFSVVKEIRDNWEKIYSNTLNHGKTLLCDDWYNDPLRKLWNFSVQKSVYRAKQFCILLPDICIPYDTNSRIKILKFLNLKGINYYEMLYNLRESLIVTLESENQTLSNFRQLDSPKECLDFDSNLISLRSANFDYGNKYTPDERPLSRIIDKCFYKP